MTAPTELARARANKYLFRAIDELPGYREALDVADQARRTLDALEAPAEVPPESHPLSTGTLTEEWVTANVAHAAALADLEQRRGILLSLQRDAQSTASGIYSSNVNRMLARLHDELTDLLGEVSTAADQLGEVRTAEEAVARDRGAEWKQLTAMAGDYQTLRAAQQTLMSGLIDYQISAKPTGGGEPHASDLYIKNLDQLWPAWRNPHGTGPQVTYVDGRQHRAEPWPTDRTQLLLWLATSDAQAWIPTTSNLDRLQAERRKRMNPMPNKQQMATRSKPKQTYGRVVPAITPLGA